MNVRSELAEPDYRALFEAAPGLFLVLLPDLTIVGVSDAYLRATMTNREEVLGRNLFDVFPDNPDDPGATGVSNLRASLDGVRASLVPALMAVQKYDIRRPDAEGGGFEERYWSTVNSPVLDADGHLTDIIHRVEDITEFVRLKALEPVNEELDRFFSLSKDMFAVLNLDGTFRRVNEAWASVLGWEPADVVGGSFIGLVHPDDLDRTMAAFETASSGGLIPTTFEVRCRHKDGSYRWLEWTGAVAAGKDIYVVGRDVSDRKAAADRFRRLVEVMPNALVVVDQHGTITLVNTQTEKLFGYSREELVGKQPEILVPASLRDNHRAYRETFFANHSTRRMGIGLDLQAQHKDGHQFPVEIGLVAIETEEGSLVLSSIIDITERKAAAAAILAARAAAERTIAKSEFLSRMSHELRTPLNAVLGFAQLLELDELSPDQRENVAYIRRAGNHLLELINEVLDISRIETGPMTISPEPVDVVDLLTDVVMLMRPLAAGRSIAIDADEATCGRHVLADRQRLKQVLVNLLANAVKYNREGGSITVACAVVAGDRLRISVTDTGYGIPSDQLGRLFRPFERLGAEQSGVEGTGMGLALSKGLVEAMGGRIGVESELDRGTTFWVELGLVEGPLEAYENERSAEKPTVAASAGRIHKVLHIEDNTSNLKLVQRIIARRPDIELISAMQGQLGIDLARQHRPDVILLDLHLPDMPGRGVLHRLRSYPETRDTPVVIISADATKTQIARLTADGATGYLTKPIDVRAFFELIDTVLGDLPPDGP